MRLKPLSILPANRMVRALIFLFWAFALAAQVSMEPSVLGRSWAPDEGVWQPGLALRAHKPSYLVLGRYSDRPNLAPQSPTMPMQAVDVSQIETKFQVSFKVCIGTMHSQRLSLWGGYTQQSHWQVFSEAQSRPFRETNYEPELILAWQPEWKVLGFDWRVVTLGINHQSNGKSEPLSRSWNRVIAQFGFERGPFAFVLRPWLRVRENRSDDDNPDLERYLGHGEVLGILKLGRHSFTGTGRLNSESGKGSFQGTWNFPLSRDGRGLRGYLQVFTGYGESLIDYNWHQNAVAIGLCLSDF